MHPLLKQDALENTSAFESKRPTTLGNFNFTVAQVNSPLELSNYGKSQYEPIDPSS